MKFEWESIYTNNENDVVVAGTSRAKVIDGWLVLNRTSIVSKLGSHLSESMVFISDPGHKWDIE